MSTTTENTPTPTPTPYEIITQLKNTSSTLDKREILRNNKNNKLFRIVLTQTLDPRITFGIKKIPKYDKKDVKYTLEEAIKMLKPLSNRDITGNKATEYLKDLLSKLNDEDEQIIKWIIAKDFKSGFGISLINDEMKPFGIYSVPYMGAVSYSEKRINDIFKNGYGISEVKMDGRYLNVVVSNNTVFTESRGGKPNPLMKCLDEGALQLAKNLYMTDVVFNGELMFSGEKDRYTANGIISSFVSIVQKKFDGVDITKELEKFEKRWNMTLDEAKDRINLVVWDFLPLENYKEKKWDKIRIKRLEQLEQACKNISTIHLIEYKKVYNKIEALEHFQEMLQRGEEGTILKSYNGIWKDGKPTYQCKMKLEITVDLMITGFNYGTPGTKNEGVISSLNVESSDGLVKTSPGGISEDDMQYITDNMNDLYNKIIEVKCCGLSEDSNHNYSLLHPVFIKIRDDKYTADSYKDIKEVEEMAKGLKF